MSEQKVWVEKMPEVCEECPYIESFEGQCKLSGRIMTGEQIYRNVKKVCPLQSIKDFKKELARQVCEKIIYNLGSIEDILINLGNGKEDALNYFMYILNKTQKEFEK